MNIARLDLWVREKEGIKILDRKAVEGIQLEKGTGKCYGSGQPVRN